MKKTIGIVNWLLIGALCVGNYFYHTVGGLDLKAACSGLFALTGLVNLYYIARVSRSRLNFAIPMAVGLIFAMLADIMLEFDFITGAALFAAGHVCYFVGQCMLVKLKKGDLVCSGVIFAGAAAFLLLFPGLTFPDSLIKAVCVVYALIISLMAGKSIANFRREKNQLTAILMAGCLMFFVSDLMLVLHWFMDTGRITSILCTAIYYPSECLLAYSIYKAE